MRIAYLRVSTEEQRPDRQIDGLTPICDELHIEKISAIAARRPIFEELLARLQPGDTLVVWALDRAFRSTVDAIQQADSLRNRGIAFQIVNLGVDTSTADGKLVFTMIAAMAEHERNRLSERTREGLDAARRRGVRLGRPSKLSNRQLRDARRKLEDEGARLTEIAALYGVHPWTLTRNLRQRILD